jgi:SAM-dependent methyltransferase
MAALSQEEGPVFGARDYLREYLTEAPVALALLRAIECRQLFREGLAHPVLDVGCGDGLFGQVLGAEPPAVGLDLSARELRSAACRRSYRALVCADVRAMPFADGSFDTVLANGVLEHVAGVVGALGEIRRVLRPEGRLLFTVPLVQDALRPGGAPAWTRVRWLARLHALAYNRVFGQVNMLTAPEWADLLVQCGLSLEAGHTYSSAGVFRLHGLMLPASLPALLAKWLLGRWILFPRLRRATWAAVWARLLRRFYEEEAAQGMWLLGVARPSMDD